MPNLTADAILPAVERLGLRAYTAEATNQVIVQMHAPEPGTTGLCFVFMPDDEACAVIVDVPLFRVAAARRAALSVYFAVEASRFPGVAWMIHDGMAYASAYVDLSHAGDAPATVAAAFERLAHAIGETYAEITRIAVGAPKRRSRAEREARALIAPAVEGDGESAAEACDATPIA